MLRSMNGLLSQDKRLPMSPFRGDQIMLSEPEATERLQFSETGSQMIMINTGDGNKLIREDEP